MVDGESFGRYRLVELLGRGLKGEVWRANDTATNRAVALKLLPAHLAEDETFQKRFRREARAAAQLNEPHIVPIHNYGELEGRLYVDMRFIEGRDLQTVLQHGPLHPARAVFIVEQVARALKAAHEMRLVHGNLKPSSILIGERDFAYLTDVGLAEVADENLHTELGQLPAARRYFPPDWVRPEAIDARSDTYELACILHECLTGRLPFPGNTQMSQMAAHLISPRPRPSAAHRGVPPSFDAVIACGMAKWPDHRFATPTDLAKAAKAALGGPTPYRP